MVQYIFKEQELEVSIVLIILIALILSLDIFKCQYHLCMCLHLIKT